MIDCGNFFVENGIDNTHESSHNQTKGHSVAQPLVVNMNDDNLIHSPTNLAYEMPSSRKSIKAAQNFLIDIELISTFLFCFCDIHIHQYSII